MESFYIKIWAVFEDISGLIGNPGNEFIKSSNIYLVVEVVRIDCSDQNVTRSGHQPHL